jgi:hypothetical protein
MGDGIVMNLTLTRWEEGKSGAETCMLLSEIRKRIISDTTEGRYNYSIRISLLIHAGDMLISKVNLT